MEHIVHIDEKIVTPKDTIQSVPTLGNVSEAGAVPSRDNAKSVIGRPKIYDLKGNLLASEENLVVLDGREFIAQVIAGKQGNNPNNYTDYQIKYFAVGDGGSSAACPPTTVGPFDDDSQLGNMVQIGDVSSVEPYKYISDGKLKQIEYDGEITIVSEEHTINVPSGGQDVVDAYTAIRYRMYLQGNEPKNKPFRFNEAGLYAVKYSPDINSGVLQPVVPEETVLFARFTTLDKYLDTSDGIMIEWYILV